MICINCYSIHADQYPSIISKQVYLAVKQASCICILAIIVIFIKLTWKKSYERHVILTHPKRPAYPSKVDLERLGLHGQGKRWEI
jgi:hypothetical protein